MANLTLWWTATGLQSDLEARTGLLIAVINNNMSVELPKAFAVRVVEKGIDHPVDTHRPAHPRSASASARRVAGVLAEMGFMPHGTTGTWWQPGVELKDLVGGDL